MLGAIGQEITVLFKVADAEGIVRGEITCAIRKWKRSQAKVGNTYATPRGHVVVTSVDVLPLVEVREADLEAAGFASIDDLARFGVEPSDDVHLVRFEATDPPDVPDRGAEDDLSVDDVADLDRRLARMDDSRPEPWTRRVLDHLATAPGTRSADLAAELGIEQQRLKPDVRRLKRLGLTRSLEKGYELSPRGRAYLERRPNRA